LVQIIRDTTKFPTRPDVYLTGPKVPLQLKQLDPTVPNDQANLVRANEELTIYLLMLPSNYIHMPENYEIIARFPTNPDQDPKGKGVVKAISVYDSHIIRSTITSATDPKNDLVQYYPIQTFKGLPPRKGSKSLAGVQPLEETANPNAPSDLDFVRAAISRLSMIPNQRYPYEKKVIQDFNWTNRNIGTLNPYPDAINHCEEGDMWINWAGTQASKPTLIYSDGAVWAREVYRLTWESNESARNKLTPAERKILEDEYAEKFANLTKVVRPSPRSIKDLQDIVAEAKKRNIRVRVFGCNHSFAPICGTSEILVDGRAINTLPRVTGPGSDCYPPTAETKCGKTTFTKFALWERYHLTLNPNDPLAKGFIGSEATATFSPGISTGDFERWIETMSNDQAPQGYKMPTSTVEDVFTMGGVLSVGCHGTGRAFPTCSDWVVAMRFVDHEGEDVTITRFSVPEKYKLKLKAIMGKDLPAAEQADGSLTEDFWKAMQVNMGAFGLIYSYTMVVFPIVKSWLIMQHLPWKDYFDDTPQARKNLFELQQQHDSCEFFYFPFMLPDDICGKKVTMIDTVYTWLTNHGPEPPHVKNMRMSPKSDYAYTGQCAAFKTTEEQWYGVDLQYHIGAVVIAAGLKNAMTNADSAKSLPDIAALFSVYVPVSGWKKSIIGCCGKEIPIAYEAPHWRSNHPIDAIGAVEFIKVVNIEYAIPINFNSPEGMAPANHAFGDIIRELNKAWDSKTLAEAGSGEAGCCGCVGNCIPCCCSPPRDSDMSHYPVTVNCEMRLLQGSGAMLCAEYTDDKFIPGDLTHEWKVRGSDQLYNGFALPELVSHSGNQGWNNFMVKMTHHMIDKFQVKANSMVRFHMAKEFASMEKMLTHVRDTFREKAVYKSSNPFDRWLSIRAAIDPNEMFLNPFLKQLLLEPEKPTYKPPNNLPLHPQGLIDECDEKLTLLGQLQPHVPGESDEGPNVTLVANVEGGEGAFVTFHTAEESEQKSPN